MRVLTWCLVFIVLFLGIPDAHSQDSVVFSHVVTKDAPKGIGANMLKRMVNGHPELRKQWKVQVYPEAVLFEDDDKLKKAMEEGKVHLAAPSISKLAEYNKKLQVFDLPFLFKDTKEVAAFIEKVKEQNLIFHYEKDRIYLNDKLDDKEPVVLLDFWHNGMKQLSSKQNLSSLIRDREKNFLKELTVRVQRGSEVAKKMFERLGAHVEEVPFKEIRKYLRQKKIDSQENTWSNSYLEKYHELQSYFLETNHGYLGYLLIANAQWWKGMTEEQRKLWKEQIIQPVTKEVNRLATEVDIEARERIREYYWELEDKGKKEVGTNSLNETDAEKWCQAIYADYADRNGWKTIVGEIGIEIINVAKEVSGNSNRCPFPQLEGITKTSGSQ
ncbi:MAG: hypothetical protein BWK78_00095 [Thiotrichaceae bacterium IS1]|nr:MAG: hypothetical protein BWK78_00095 [Thiotrichaceae bacterium IS1]